MATWSRSTPTPACSTCTSRRTTWRPARPPYPTTPGSSAPAASSSRPSAPSSARPTWAPACSTPPRSRRRTSMTDLDKLDHPGGLVDRVPVVPVVVLHDLDHAVPVARALVEGGLPVIELTLRTPVALDAIEAIATHVPEILVGAGTIVAPAQAKDALSAGAQFLVSPGTTEALAAAMQETGLPHLPGAATVSEVLRFHDTGTTEMKFFPAEAAGGVDFLKSVGSPVPQARFCPTGGSTSATATSYLRLPNVGCVGGSWLTPADAVLDGDWARVAQL